MYFLQLGSETLTGSVSSPELEAGAGAGTGSGTNCIWGSDEELLVGTEPMFCRALTTAGAVVVLSEAKWS